MREGPLAALDAIAQATGERDANVIGYCLGGTLLAATLAYMAVKRDNRIRSATFFVTMVDFAEAGELSVFIDEEQLQALEERMNAKGYLEGRDMATTFNMLRANDLIWSFVVNNYLLGKSPFPFDLLYWNADSTRMPAAMHSFYLRSMYQENLLVRPGGISLDGVPIDLGRIKTPAFLLSTREDHIAPWHSTYAATQLYKGRSSSCSRLPATSPASSIRPAANTAIGRTTRTRRRRRNGSPARPGTPIPGGRYGKAGSPNMPAARCPRATRATAGSNRSRMPPAPTSKFARRIDPRKGSGSAYVWLISLNEGW